jgi:elongation factor G
MGELHLEIIVDRMKREFGVGSKCRAKPQVAYRETIHPACSLAKKSTRNRLAVAASLDTLRLRSSRHPGEGLVVREQDYRVVRYPKDTSSQSSRELEKLWSAGFLAGYELVDIKVPVCSTVITTRSIRTSARFILPGRLAFQDAVRKGLSRYCFEPIMRIDVVTA